MVVEGELEGEVGLELVKAIEGLQVKPFPMLLLLLLLLLLGDFSAPLRLETAVSFRSAIALMLATIAGLESGSLAGGGGGITLFPVDHGVVGRRLGSVLVFGLAGLLLLLLLLLLI